MILWGFLLATAITEAYNAGTSWHIIDAFAFLDDEGTVTTSGVFGDASLVGSTIITPLPSKDSQNIVTIVST